MNKQYELQIEIENQCLLDCIHCSSASMRQAGIRHFLDQDVLTMISIFHEPLHIYFTGGEPILYEGLLPLCEQIASSKHNATIGLYTTGNMQGLNPISASLATKMKQAGIVDCYFSVYSNLAEEQDWWTCQPGSFRNTLLSVNALAEAGISPKAHLVLTKMNIHKLDQIITFCQDLSIEEIRILKLTPSGNAQVHWDRIGLPLDVQNEIIARLISHKDNYPVKLTFSGYPRLHPCRSFPWSKKCQAGTNLLYVDANGDIYPCACTKRAPSVYKICHITNIPRLKAYISSKNCVECNEDCLNEDIS